MEDGREQLHAIHETRAGPAEVRGSVYADDPRTGDGTERRSDAADVREHPLDVRRVEWHDHRLAFELRWDAIERDRANSAERLAEDDVGARLAQPLLVKVEGALAAAARFADESVDLACARARRNSRSGDAREREGSRREVVVVRDRDKPIGCAERPDHLCGGRYERDDAH